MAEAEKGRNDLQLQLQLQPKKQEEISKDEEKEKSGCSSFSTLACMDLLRELSYAVSFLNLIFNLQKNCYL